MMVAILSISGIVGGTSLACIAPRTPYEKHVDIIGALVLISSLSLIGSSLALRMCL
jgi:hypothetical protein